MVSEEIKVNIEDSPIPTLAITADGGILYHNRAAEKLLGKIGDGMKFSSFFSGEEIPEVLKTSTAVKLALDEGASLYYLRSSSGKLIYASVFCSADPECKTLYIRDISSQIKYITQVKRHLETESKLQRSVHIRNGNLQEALREIAVASAHTMEVKRVNIWEIDNEFSSIKSLVNYDENQGGFVENITLYRHQFPRYFNLMQTEEIIATVDARNNPQTEEIRDNYIIPFGIYSLLDTPIRIEGKMVGVICFEDTDVIRSWNVSEHNFVVSIAQIIAQTLETSHRQKAQQELEQALAEKKVLLSEINHRVKNNFSLIDDLVRLQESRAQDEFHQKLFSDIRSKLLSMTMIHRQLYLSDNFGIVNFRDFLLDLAAHFRSTYANNGIEISTRLENIRLPIGKAVLCGLIVNELLSNACREIISGGENDVVTLKMNTIGETVSLFLSVTKPSRLFQNSNVGLINELVGQLHGFIEYPAGDFPVTKLGFSVT